MSSLLKDIYSPLFYDKLADSFSTSIPSFDKAKFIADIFTDNFKSMELKQRMKHTALALHRFLPAEFSKTVPILQKMIDQLLADHFRSDALEFMFLPDYIETYGIDDYENAVTALEFTTQFVSCEFAVRPFLIKYGEKMISQMKSWSLHSSARVRRLASEGSRPKLPWAMAVPALKKDPTSIIPILENLKTDVSESVRRSVANSLNDIAKDHPEIVLEIASRWSGVSKETDAIVRHGSRTLLKHGHAGILNHYGLTSHSIAVTDFQIDTPAVNIGENLEFSFRVQNQLTVNQAVRLEYAIYYVKANGQLSKKVFKISERVLGGNEIVSIARRQSFRLITTRKFYAGAHRLSLIVNGEEKTAGDFILNESKDLLK
ncbi:DNA alkylation repair protein [Dyadobacter sp. CY312]|uniref:DNA alkylation repair protein n=1 Tax=Dyadobacter sp. CY312 TaxID=2907303 RepID=UPI001F31F604|nr:DNA alkylation repair protein [Dyadobacter sp. CY312]MCE7043257.1 DNA alkylation repair protein [Dyadobacter sp. CY312]